jgi:hypothetical protein
MASSETESEHESEEATVPLQHLKPFGAGLKRKPITFVPATSPSAVAISKANAAEASARVHDYYVATVLSNNNPALTEDHVELCPTCNTPLYPGHEFTIPHQLARPYSAPPHALDRSRRGLKYLESYGWDADARAGLGPAGQGIAAPLKVKEKQNTLGIGAKIPKAMSGKVEKRVILGAKGVRKQAALDKKKSERLQQEFYGNSEVEKYLGAG